MSSLNSTNPTVDKYKYFVFDVILNKDDYSQDRVIDELRSYLNGIGCNTLNIIYPTHDKRLYMCLKESNYSRIATAKAIQVNSNISLLKFEPVDFSFSEHGYFELKNDTLKDVDGKENYMEDTFGVSFVTIKEVDSQKEKKMIKADSYQKNLIDFVLNHGNHDSVKIEFFNSNVETVENKDSNSIIDGKNIKLISNDDIKGLEYEYVDKNLKVVINKDNLLDQDVDIIVNAANVQLLFGGGVAGAIYSRCGRPIETECQNIIKKRGCSMNVGEVVHSGSYNINKTCKHIIHACGPMWSDYSKNKKETCYKDLKNTFFNIFVYADNILKDCSSISLPLISSGIFGVPKEMCCKALLESINEFLAESNNSHRNLKLIKLTNIDQPTYSELLEYFRNRLNINSSSPQDESENDKFNRLSEISIDEYNNMISSVKCCCCSRESSVKELKCGCKYCSDCLNILEQQYDDKCQNENCLDRKN